LNGWPDAPERVLIELDMLPELPNVSGGNPNATLQRIRESARSCSGLLLLVHPSTREAVSAILGSLESSSNDGSPRIYIVDSRREQLTALFAELSQLDLAGAATLFHGSISDFFRDVPLRADFVCIGSQTQNLPATHLLANVPARTPILCLRATEESSEAAALESLIASGIIEIGEAFPGGAAGETTSLCQGSGFLPDASSRIILQGRLHERYFLSGTVPGGSYTPVADLTEDVRREYSRQRAPARGLSSWPFMARDSGLPSLLPSGKPWPKISIVTPTRNQGKFIEETILSVLNQGYPNLEYIIVDGASTDDTMPIVKRYRPMLALVISEPDKGQSDAINKGMARTTGDILTWLNSDDMLAPGALAAIAMAFDTNDADMIAGICQRYQDGRVISQHLTSCADGPLPVEDLLDLDHAWNAGQFFHQPEVMFTRDLWVRAGGHLDEGLFYSLDYELWLRFARAGARLHVIGRPLAWFRVHEEQKTYALSSFMPELVRCRDSFLKETGLKQRPAPAKRPDRLKLSVTFLNDHGGFYGAGIAHVRLARALAWAGHDVSMVAVLDTPSEARDSKWTTESVLARVVESKPDLVIVGNLHNANADPLLLNLLSERFPTLLVLHDFWILTGRCAYTNNCQKYLTGCDESCPTPTEYPALPPIEIADAWRKKRLLLSASSRPTLLANSEWTAAFTGRALAGTALASEQSLSVDVFRLSFPVDLFRPRNKHASREHFGLPADRFLVLVPASLDDPRKGVRPFLEALARLEIPNLTVVTIGWPSSRVDLPIDVVQLGYFHDPKRVALLNSAVDVVVVPSSAETFGQICIEAIACGTVVAGYPLAAVPEAIRDGVTGLLAADADPSSLAATVHHLYVHPELRNDLARWGRIYIENEWSEFSAYRHFFLALHRLGLAQSLGLQRKIGLLPCPPPLPKFQSVWRSASHWRPLRGFSGVEQAIEHSGTSFRWAFGPAAVAEIVVDAPGPHQILIAYRNPHEGQTLKLRLDGALLGTYELSNTGYNASRVLSENVRFDCERSLLHFEFSRWHSPQENGRRLAIMVNEILIEKVEEWDQLAQVPSSQQALAAVWETDNPKHQL